MKRKEKLGLCTESIISFAYSSLEHYVKLEFFILFLNFVSIGCLDQT